MVGTCPYFPNINSRLRLSLTPVLTSPYKSHMSSIHDDELTMLSSKRIRYFFSFRLTTKTYVERKAAVHLNKTFSLIHLIQLRTESLDLPAAFS